MYQNCAPLFSWLCSHYEDWYRSASWLSAFWEQLRYNVSFTGIFFPSKKAINCATLMFWLFMWWIQLGAIQTEELDMEPTLSTAFGGGSYKLILLSNLSYLYDLETVRPRAFITLELVSDRKRLTLPWKCIILPESMNKGLNDQCETLQPPFQWYLNSCAAKAAGTAPPLWKLQPQG